MSTNFEERYSYSFIPLPDMLKRYWIEFEGNPADIWPCIVGCGVTAYDLEDACALVRANLFTSKEMPKIKKVEEDIDVSKLDSAHVLPNIGIPCNRGIWFPRI